MRARPARDETPQPGRAARPGTGWRDDYASIDLRSLGLFRILLAAVLLSDWFARWPNLLAFYTADGFLPGDAVLATAAGGYRFNFLAGVTSLGAVRCVFLAGLVSHALFFLGWRTRFFNATSFLFYLSVLQRNELIGHGGDHVLLLFCMWALFLPLGSRFSLDAAERALRLGKDAGPADLRLALAAEPPRSAPGLAALVIVLQIGLVHFLAAVDKSGETWQQGTAVYYALHLDHFATPIGVWLRERPLGLLRSIAWGTLVLEYAALPLLLLPWGRPWARRMTILALACMHVGFSLAMTTGTFSAAMLASLALCLSGRDWDWIERCLSLASRPVTTYYDDTCGICRRAAALLAAADRAGRIRWIGSSDRTAFEDDISPAELDTSLVSVERSTGRRFVQVRAVAAVSRALPLPFHLLRLLTLPGLAQLGNGAYDWVARNRGRWSQWLGDPVCGVPARAMPAGSATDTAAQRLGQRGRRVLAGAVVALLFAAFLVEAWNSSIAPRFGWPATPRTATQADLVAALRLSRGRSMVAPEPARFDGWWVLDGQNARGERVDPLTGAPPHWSKPQRADAGYDVFWRLYLTRLCLPEHSQVRPWFGAYLTRRDRRLKPAAEQLQSFDFWYVREVTQPPGTPEPFATERLLLWRYDCAGGRMLLRGE